MDLSVFDVVGFSGAGGGREAVLVTERDAVLWGRRCACLAVTAGKSGSVLYRFGVNWHCAARRYG